MAGLTSTVSLFIVDDQIVVRAGFNSVLRSQAGLKVMGSASSGEEALIFLERCAVDVLLLDLHMPGLGGLGTLLALQQLPCPPQAIILSSFEPDQDICRAVEIGAAGYLRKDTSLSEIVDAVREVHLGRTYFPEWIVARISERKSQSSLSRRELEILEMVARGLTNKEIGRALQVSPFTVRNHVRHIMAKLEAGDRTEAATVAIQQGIFVARDWFHSTVRSQRNLGPPNRRSDLLAAPPIQISGQDPSEPRRDAEEPLRGRQLGMRSYPVRSQAQ
jgi:two-component system, NarL family, response regulator